MRQTNSTFGETGRPQIIWHSLFGLAIVWVLSLAYLMYSNPDNLYDLSERWPRYLLLLLGTVALFLPSRWRWMALLAVGLSLVTHESLLLMNSSSGAQYLNSRNPVGDALGFQMRILESAVGTTSPNVWLSVIPDIFFPKAFAALSLMLAGIEFSRHAAR